MLSVFLLASTWQVLLSHHIRHHHHPPTHTNPQPCPHSLFLSFSSCYCTGITEGIKQRQVLLFSKEARKKNNQKSGGLKKDQNYFSNRMGKSNMPYHRGEQAVCERPGLWLPCRLFWIDAWHCQRTCHCVAERHLQYCIKIRLSCHPQTSQSCCSFFLSFFLKEKRRKIRNVPRIRPSKPDKRYFWKTLETGHPGKATS